MFRVKRECLVRLPWKPTMENGGQNEPCRPSIAAACEKPMLGDKVLDKLFYMRDLFGNIAKP